MRLLTVASLFCVVLSGSVLVLITRVHNVELVQRLGDVVKRSQPRSESSCAAPPDPRKSLRPRRFLLAPLAIMVPIIVASPATPSW
jgi:hypothetical protein